MPGGIEVVAEAEVHGELGADLPLVLNVEEGLPEAVGGELDGEVALEGLGNVEEHAGERIDLVEHGGAGRGGLIVAELEFAAGAAGVLGLEEFFADAAEVDAPLDGVVALELGEVSDVVEVGFGAVPGD